MRGQHLAMTAAIVMTMGLGACSLTDVPDPSTIVDPGTVQTQDGAIDAYHGGVGSFGAIFGGTQRPGSFFVQRGYSYVMASGFASDELGTQNYDNTGEFFAIRLVDPGAGHDILQPYSDMHTTRLNIDQAIGELRQYGKTTPASYIGELFALKGYIYLMFGEMYCSGVPFSKAIYGGDIVLGQPETTTQMYNDAIAQFDTAIAVATDSVRIRELAYVGKARAQVDLGLFSDAAATASSANVPDDFTYDLTYSTQTSPNFFVASTSMSTPFGATPSAAYMGNRLGTNGLAYVDAGDPTGAAPDPRVAWFPVNQAFGGGPLPIPSKYPDGSAPITLASGIEARLIEAEAALQAHDVAGWAGILNDLRQNAISPAIPPLPADSTTTASDTLQQNVMFRERAFWLYGTGHRMGDMRRLIRQYHRTIQQTFPQGLMSAAQGTPLFYTSNAVFVPPSEEFANNPNYHGCLNRDP